MLCDRPVDVTALADRGISVDVVIFLAVGIHDFATPSSLLISFRSALSVDSTILESFDLTALLLDGLSTDGLSASPF